MRGYFGIGVEGISKEYNAGNLMRSAHSFGSSFFFTISPAVDMRAMRHADTSLAFEHMPYYQYDNLAELKLPMKCQMVAVELTEDAIELPSFKHPLCAAYILGSEMSSVSDELLEQCEFTIKIPMKFCVNVGVAGALVMYDRLISMGRFADRPVKAGGPAEKLNINTGLAGNQRRKIRTASKSNSDQ